tara:strand:- start:31 stop:729 length:699 start_codon:yes stop_codon:yes gene_type:complete
MKVVILAGGKGTRISEYTKSIPKPMIKIKKYPLIFHVMKIYAKHGYKDFIIATGYKNKIIKRYFKKKIRDWKIKIVFTGLNTMTGGRIKRLKNYLNGERFFLTYGDGVSSVDLKKLLKFHKKNKSTVTLTAVRPPARFGAIKIKGNKVNVFREKSALDEGWINGGFFVMEQEVFKYLKNDNTYLEREPLTQLGKKGKLFAFKHYGFWKCVDTKRDKVELEKLIKKNSTKKYL